MTLYQTTDSPSTLKINEAIQAMLAEVGIKAEIKQMDDAAYFGTRKEGKLGSYVSNWSADYNDPDNFIYTFFGSPNSAARSWNYTNKEVQDKLAAGAHHDRHGRPLQAVPGPGEHDRLQGLRLRAALSPRTICSSCNRASRTSRCRGTVGATCRTMASS